jgi:hypothetical protein
MEHPSNIPRRECSFTFTHYKNILRKAKDNGYTFITMEEYAKGKRADKLIIIRHDIDFSPSSALEFAKIENEFGVRAAYFVRVHADNYNPFGFKTYNEIRKIIELGHDIGLHYENLDFSDISKQDPRTVILKEKKVLELIFDLQIKGIAPHRDFTPIINKNFLNDVDFKKIDFEYEAYMKEFFEDILYLSDSLGKWSGEGKCLCHYINKENKIYVLLHPCYWYHTSYHLEREY